MKKFISVLVVAVMVLALAAPAFADGPSPAGPAAEIVVPELGGAVDAATGAKVDVVVSQPELAAGETVESVAADATAAAEAAGVDVAEAVAAEVFDVSMSDGSQPDGSVKVTIVREKGSGEIAAVMYQAEDGSWDKADFIEGDDGTVTITFEHFCTVVLLVKAPEEAPDVKPDTPSDTPSSTTPSGPASPQTGYIF